MAVPPVSASDFRRVSSHIVAVQPRRISQFISTRELVLVLRDAVYAHKGYFEAGFIHRNVAEANVWIFEGESEEVGEGEGEARKKLVAGALLELDSCYLCRRYRPGDELDVLEMLALD